MTTKPIATTEASQSFATLSLKLDALAARETRAALERARRSEIAALAGVALLGAAGLTLALAQLAHWIR